MDPVIRQSKSNHHGFYIIAGPHSQQSLDNGIRKIILLLGLRTRYALLSRPSRLLL